MKKYTITLGLLLAGAFMFAQQNVIKVGLGSVFQSDLQLKYERSFAENHSFQIGILADFTERIDNEGLQGLPIVGVGVDEPFSVAYGGFAIIPEYRYYFSKKGSPRGFYAGLYGRYRQRNGSIDSAFGTDIELDASARLFNIGAGVGIGAQFLIADKFSIDWYIGGLGYNQFFLSANLQPLNDDDFDRLQMDLIREINDVSFEDLGGDDSGLSREQFDELKTTTLNAVTNAENQEFDTGNISFGLLDIRLGLSLGYAF